MKKQLGVLWLCVVPMLAQVGTEGSLVGTVTDPTGAGVPRAQVVATNDATGSKWSVLSGSRGDFTILPVPAGV